MGEGACQRSQNMLESRQGPQLWDIYVHLSTSGLVLLLSSLEFGGMWPAHLENELVT